MKVYVGNFFSRAAWESLCDDPHQVTEDGWESWVGEASPQLEDVWLNYGAAVTMTQTALVVEMREDYEDGEIEEDDESCPFLPDGTLKTTFTWETVRGINEKVKRGHRPYAVFKLLWPDGDVEGIVVVQEIEVSGEVG